MEALNLIVHSKLVADEVRHSTSGYDEVRWLAEQALRAERPKRRLWSALRRSASKLIGRRPAGNRVDDKEVVNRRCLVTQSSGD